MSIHLVVPDTHSHYQHNNDRADWLAGLINDVRPTTVIHLGDSADLPSLSSYDKGKRAFNGRTYAADIDSHLEFQDRMWGPVYRRKQKLPRRVFIIGNHEQRIEKALELSPELQGTIGMEDLNLGQWYTDVVPYEGGTPGIINVDGIHYAHYFVSGVMGRPVGGEHPAYSLLTKHFTSCTCGHIHVADHSVRTTVDGRRIHGLVAGVYQDYDSDWAGEINKLWTRGVFIKRNVNNGDYDLQFVSIESLKKEYGT